MTTPSSPSVPQSSPKSSEFSGCIVTGPAILFAIPGIYDLVFGSTIAYVFSSVRMFSPASVAIVLIVACDCFIYFFLAFLIKRQHWLISLVLLAVDSGLALFDALGSREKTLHANLGGHTRVPSLECESWERFFKRHLQMQRVG